MGTILWLCPSLPTETLKWLSSLPILMQKSFWWWQCSDRYIISLSPHLCTPFPPFSPSLISHTVSVDVKHHVYLPVPLRRQLGVQQIQQQGGDPDLPSATNSAIFLTVHEFIVRTNGFGVVNRVATDGNQNAMPLLCLGPHSFPFPFSPPIPSPPPSLSPLLSLSLWKYIVTGLFFVLVRNRSFYVEASSPSPPLPP